MPFISVKILEGHNKERKQQIVAKITDAVTEVTEIPKESVWVVIEDIPKKDWAVGGKLLEE